jgi:hypothetical protein
MDALGVAGGSITVFGECAMIFLSIDTYLQEVRGTLLRSACNAVQLKLIEVVAGCCMVIDRECGSCIIEKNR